MSEVAFRLAALPLGIPEHDTAKPERNARHQVSRRIRRDVAAYIENIDLISKMND